MFPVSSYPLYLLQLVAVVGGGVRGGYDNGFSNPVPAVETFVLIEHLRCIGGGGVGGVRTWPPPPQAYRPDPLTTLFSGRVLGRE